MRREVKDILLFHELPLWLAWITVTAFLVFPLKETFFHDLTHLPAFLFLFLWLFTLVIWNSFEIAHHVEMLTESIREPLGTLVLTFSVTSIEITAIANVMLISNENPTLARDTMYSIIMIVLNGVVGLSLLLGGIRYREQRYNLRGSMEFISVIMVLAIIDLVLPDFTQSTTNHTFSKGQSVFLLLISIAIYAIFLGMQTISHTKHFISPFESHQPSKPMRIHIKYRQKNALYHGLIIVGYLVPTLFLAKQIAFPIDSALMVLNLPQALGGLIVAILVLAPEGVSAIRASLSNHLQRSVNIALGAVLATTALTIPIILAIGLWTGQAVILGLDAGEMTLLSLSLITSIATFVNGRSSLLQGALHLLLFFSFVMLIFD